MIEIPTLAHDGAIPAYRADPDSTPKAAVIIIQEIFGVNRGVRNRCDRWAALGYLAIAPDLFWRIKPGVELNPDVPEEFQQALHLMQRFDQEQGVKDIEAAIRFAHAESGGGKVGAVGYCLGGRLAFMAAARTDVNASVGYYGVGLEGLLGEKHAIAHPLLLHIAQNDHFVTPDKQALIHQGLDDHPKVTIHDYPGVDHGFASDEGKRRNDDAASLADSRTEAFFAEHLA
jgi:carboxymethylenebutenolidase